MVVSSAENFRSIRSMRSLLVEDVVYSVLVYVVLFLFSQNFVSYALMQALLIILVTRIFNIRHERTHLPLHTKNFGLFAISNLIEIFHTPWQEPFSEQRKKHILHHQDHSGKERLTLLENPHAAMEKGFVSSFLSATFYHEVMLTLDLVRDRKLSHFRVGMVLFTSFVIALTIFLVGWKSFLLFVLAYRIATMIAWFTFSYLLHLDGLYQKELGPSLPLWLRRFLEYAIGSGSVTAIFYHRYHHRRPTSYHRF